MAKKILTISFILFLAACNKYHPIYNVDHQDIHTGSGNIATLEQVQTAVRKAILKKTWQIIDAGPNSFEAMFNKGKASAVITIEFSTTRYSILYLDDQHLSVGTGNIHRNYNRWIRGLQKTINLNLADL